MLSYWGLQAAIAALLISFFFLKAFFKGANRNLPPGPKSLPFIGNLLDFPPKNVTEYEHWLKHKDAYGPISSVSVMGQTLVLLHDRRAAEDLLSRQSKKSSGRPEMEFANRLCGYGDLMACQQDDDRFRRCRRLVHQQLGTHAALTRFSDTQELETRRFLLRVLDRPETLLKQLKVLTGAIILKMTYGYSIEPIEADPLVDLIEVNMANFPHAMVPMTWMVDLIPALKNLPDGFPGTAFKRIARRWNKINRAVADVPFAFVQKQMASGCHQPSFVSSLIEQKRIEGKNTSMPGPDQDDIKWTAADMYGGGSAALAAQTTSFVVAMILFPEVQRRAQDEIDRVVGSGRLPRLEDRNRLPYVEGVVKETFRWFTVTPLGAPHVMSEDVTYDGQLFPKGAILLPAVWWFLHDPDVYSEPDAFDPTRYIAPRSAFDPKEAVFGYGRRVCPGRNLADASVFLTVAQLLAAFNIRKAVDADGNEIEAELRGIRGMVNHPAEFPYRLEPRTAKAVELVRNVEVERPWEGSHAASVKEATLVI